MTLVFKICPAGAWAAAQAAGHYAGSPDDARDGFIHLSAADQVEATLARHFAGQDGLLLVAFNAADLGGLRWEASRGGALFPHLYGVLATGAARWVKPLPLLAGRHELPPDLAS